MDHVPATATRGSLPDDELLKGKNTQTATFIGVAAVHSACRNMLGFHNAGSDLFSCIRIRAQNPQCNALAMMTEVAGDQLRERLVATFVTFSAWGELAPQSCSGRAPSAGILTQPRSKSKPFNHHRMEERGVQSGAGIKVPRSQSRDVLNKVSRIFGLEGFVGHYSKLLLLGSKLHSSTYAGNLFQH